MIIVDVVYKDEETAEARFETIEEAEEHIHKLMEMAFGQNSGNWSFTLREEARNNGKS